MASLTSDQKKPKTVIEEKVLERVKPLIPKTKKEIKKEKEAEMFQMVEEFKKLKKKNPLGMRDMTFSMFRELKIKEKNLIKNELLKLAVKYPEKKIFDEFGGVNTEEAKEAIDAAVVDLEIEPIDGLTLQRSIDTKGEQSVTSGEYSIGNFNFSSPNIEEGILKTDAAFNLGDLNLTAAANTDDSKLLNTKLGFNYDNELKGSVFNEGDYTQTDLELDKTFNLADNITANLEGSANISKFDGETYKSSDLTPKLSYNDGIISADISKEILKGGDLPNFNLGASFPINQETFSGDLILDANGKIQFDKNGIPLRKSSYTKDMGKITLKGTDLLSENRSGKVGYEKTLGDKDGDFYYTIGGEIDPFSGDKTAGGAIKYRFAKGGRVKMSKGGIAEILKL